MDQRPEHGRNQKESRDRINNRTGWVCPKERLAFILQRFIRRRLDMVASI